MAEPVSDLDSGLIDVTKYRLEDLNTLEPSHLQVALERLVRDEGAPFAGFQSSI